MLSLRQLFAYLASAAAALLTCVSGVDLHKPDTGAISLVFQRAQESAPRGILNRLGQPVVLEHPLDVQVLRSDKPETTYQVQRYFVMVFTPEICYSGVSSGDLFVSLSPVFAAELLAVDRPLLAFELRKLVFVEPWIGDMLSVGCAQEMLKANVDSDGRSFTWLNLDFSEIAREYSVPTVCFTLDRDCLDLAFYFAVHLDFHKANAVNTEFSVYKFDAVSIGRKFDRVELRFALETRIARLFSRFYSSEEGLERLVKSSQSGLTTAKVQFRKLGTQGPQGLQLSGLIAVADAFFMASPIICTPSQGIVVKPTMHVQGELASLGLVVVGIQQEFIGSSHGLFILTAAKGIVKKIAALKKKGGGASPVA